MKITIEPETDEEKAAGKAIIYDGACEYAIGTQLEGGSFPKRFHAWTGVREPLYGLCHELAERIRSHGGNRTD